ncbi:hypothetical protein GC197_17745 [bacterium]|nr:hypothetical protein [bacterium]
MMIYRAASVALAMSMCAFLATGCSSSVSKVSGKVFLDGHPLDGAVITFKPKGVDGGREISTNVTKGAFEFTSDRRMKPGDYFVKFVSQQPGAGQMVQSVEKGEGIPPPKTYVPKVYEKEGTLIKKVTLEGPNYFVFQLSSGGF